MHQTVSSFQVEDNIVKKNKFVWEKWHNPIEEELNSYSSMFMPYPDEEDVAEELDALRLHPLHLGMA